ncbi:ribonuclease HIII [Desertibacillus haloalkaliphilus]|uniref:ribonuclease HIII n=1 Tax=Desertibacillus haloalkaliphilus TaxID=1328930 RepID=UPI001C26DD23|nr:ribonuclease HIII [Desertibacillus haloalkaliphilus]MBU8905117.1 ribonuclease HIII [Desertibacillus haloalkaliphilus]
MANSVLKVSTATIAKMKEHYSTYVQTKSPQGAVFTAKPPGCTITAYHSGKVLFQGKNGEVEASQWQGETSASQANSTQKKPKKAHGYEPPQHIESMSIIGSDEVGTGDYFGPITVVAAFVGRNQIALMKELGVKDSKHLTDKQIVAIAKDLIKTIPYSLLVLRNEKYNQMQQKGMSQGKMKAILHNRALLNVIDKLEGTSYDGILIDQFVEPTTFFSHLKSEKRKLQGEIFFSTKAEGIHLSVAAASIIARYAFLKEFEALSAEAGFDIPKGAGRHVDVAAAQLMKAKGADQLNHFVKLHFANTMKAKQLASASH